MSLHVVRQYFPHVVLASVPIYGHIEKFAIIATDLVKRGYPVTFTTGTVWRELVEETGAKFVALQGNADFDGRNFEKAFPAWKSLPPGPARFGYLRHMLIDQIRDQHESLQEILFDAGTRGEKTVVLQDITFFGMNPVLLGAPGVRPAGVITVGHTPLPLFSIDTAPFGSGLPPDSSEGGRARNIVENEKIRAIASVSQASFIKIMKSLGAEDISDSLLDLAVIAPDRFLQLCIRGFEYPRSDAPDNLRYIGYFPSSPTSNKPLPPWWNTVLKHERPLVVVSQGTLANHDYGDLILPTLEGLRDLDVQVVTTLVRSASFRDNFKVPQNVLVAQFIPFDELFKYADVVVNNGGFGTVQTAFSLGVPMVLAGQTEEKTETNARAGWTGAAINLATQKPTSRQVREAVEEVLTDPKYKARALELRDEYRKCDALTSIAATIEELANGSSIGCY
ncbi:glycosyltransferase family 1 protein [Stipitochalara longipes BDJ]|nr:glycosyltransferase family 1 protein [Stipitochalara longipes BDJ]